MCCNTGQIKLATCFRNPCKALQEGLGLQGAAVTSAFCKVLSDFQQKQDNMIRWFQSVNYTSGIGNVGEQIRKGRNEWKARLERHVDSCGWGLVPVGLCLKPRKVLLCGISENSLNLFSFKLMIRSYFQSLAPSVPLKTQEVCETRD